MSLLVNTLGKLENSYLLDVAAREVVGINAPKMAITRSWDERLDVATFEVGNTVAAFGPTLLIDKVLKKTLYKPNMTAIQKKWAQLGHSMGILFPMFGLMWAMSFIRNYMTTKRSGKVDFKDVITKGKAEPLKQNPYENLKAVNAKLDKYKKNTLQIMGAFLGLGAASIAMGRYGAKHSLKMGPIGQAMDKLFGFGEKGFSNFGKKKWDAFVFWGVSSYLGALQGARDKFELKEQILKFFAFNFAFFVPAMVADKHYGKKFVEKLGQKTIDQIKTHGDGSITKKAIHKALESQPALEKTASKIWLNRTVTGLVSSIFLLGLLPAGINILLTKKRIENEANNHASNPLSMPSLSFNPSQPLQKNFSGGVPGGWRNDTAGRFKH